MITKQRQAEREGREGESEKVGEVNGDACGQELRNKERTNRVKGKGGSEIRQHREDGSGLRKNGKRGRRRTGFVSGRKRGFGEKTACLSFRLHITEGNFMTLQGLQSLSSASLPKPSQCCSSVSYALPSLPSSIPSSSLSKSQT